MVEKLGKFYDPYKDMEYDIVKIKISDVEISPFQREVSPSLVRSLVGSIDKMGFMTPIIISEKDGKYYVIDGQHRLLALKELVSDENYITAILIPWEDKLIYNFAFNIERSPNVKDKSKQVYKMFMEELNNNPDNPEDYYASMFEKPYYITFGITLEEVNPRFSPGMFERFAEKVEWWLDGKIKDTYKERQRRAKRFQELYDTVNQRFNELGLTNSLLKAQIVSKAMQDAFGVRARTIEYPFDEAVDRLKDAIKNVVISNTF